MKRVMLSLSLVLILVFASVFTVSASFFPTGKVVDESCVQSCLNDLCVGLGLFQKFKCKNQNRPQCESQCDVATGGVATFNPSDSSDSEIVVGVTNLGEEPKDDSTPEGFNKKFPGMDEIWQQEQCQDESNCFESITFEVRKSAGGWATLGSSNDFPLSYREIEDKDGKRTIKVNNYRICAKLKDEIDTSSALGVSVDLIRNGKTAHSGQDSGHNGNLWLPKSPNQDKYCFYPTKDIYLDKDEPTYQILVTFDLVGEEIRSTIFLLGLDVPPQEGKDYQCRLRESSRKTVQGENLGLNYPFGEAETIERFDAKCSEICPSGGNKVWPIGKVSGGCAWC